MCFHCEALQPIGRSLSPPHSPNLFFGIEVTTASMRRNIKVPVPTRPHARRHAFLPLLHHHHQPPPPTPPSNWNMGHHPAYFPWNSETCSLIASSSEGNVCVAVCVCGGGEVEMSIPHISQPCLSNMTIDCHFRQGGETLRGMIEGWGGTRTPQTAATQGKAASFFSKQGLRMDEALRVPLPPHACASSSSHSYRSPSGESCAG